MSSLKALQVTDNGQQYIRYSHHGAWANGVYKGVLYKDGLAHTGHSAGIIVDPEHPHYNREHYAGELVHGLHPVHQTFYHDGIPCHDGRLGDHPQFQHAVPGGYDPDQHVYSGKIAHGWVEHSDGGRMWNNGKLHDGWLPGVNGGAISYYMKGVPITGMAEINDKMHVFDTNGDHKSVFTGMYNGLYYWEGKPLTGTTLAGNYVCSFAEGRNTGKYSGLYQNKMYSDGEPHEGYDAQGLHYYQKGVYYSTRTA